MCLVLLEPEAGPVFENEVACVELCAAVAAPGLRQGSFKLAGVYLQCA